MPSVFALITTIATVVTLMALFVSVARLVQSPALDLSFVPPTVIAVVLLAVWRKYR